MPDLDDLSGNPLLPADANDPALRAFLAPKAVVGPSPNPLVGGNVDALGRTPQQAANMRANPSRVPAGAGLPTQPTVNAQTVAANPASAAVSDASVRQYVLNRIAKSEASDYNVMYGGSRFSSFADHPRQLFHTPDGTPTHAAGRYQFQPGTWDAEAKNLGLKDFSPESQDAAAWDLAQTTYRQNTHRDLSADVRAGKTQWSALGDQWSSLKNSAAGGTPSASNSAAPSGAAGGQPNAGGGSPLAAEGTQAAPFQPIGQSSMLPLMLLQNLFPQHKFTPVQYDPFAVAPKLG